MRLVHLSEGVLERLKQDIEGNLGRYLGHGFSDLADDPGWALQFDALDIDVSPLAALDGSDASAAFDLKNTKVVDEVLGAMAPSLAREERIWARLTHVEAFAYTRDRWLVRETSREKQIESIRTHFFAAGRTGIRDDNALSRLWWNARIVRACMLQDVERGLSLLLKTADIRSNIVERVGLTGRRPLAAGLFRKMARDERVHSSEAAFREFMKAVNRAGSGVVFEAMSEAQIDAFLDRCAEEAPKTAA